MEPAFSELQYAYSCTRELESGTWLFPPLGMPFFPSTVAEGRGAPYDVRFGPGERFALVFIQYKVAHYLTTRKAKQWGLFGHQYLRFGIYPASRSPQHNDLVELASTEPFVFYCAPAFASHRQLVAFHRLRSVAANSVFVPCVQLPRIHGRDRHHVSYDRYSSFGYWHSDAKKVDLLVGFENLVGHCRGTSDSFAPVHQLVTRIERQFDLKSTSWDEGDTVRRLQTLAVLIAQTHSLSLGVLRYHDWKL